MNFLEAVKEMKEGKKVKLKSWDDKSRYIYLEDDNYIYNSKGMEASISNISFFDATDWEVVEEKKTLSDKIHYNGTENNVSLDDVKASLKEFIEKYNLEVLENLELVNTEMYKLAKEIFGERLLDVK